MMFLLFGADDVVRRLRYCDQFVIMFVEHDIQKTPDDNDLKLGTVSKPIDFRF